MYHLKYSRYRSEGYREVNYDALLSRFQCVSRTIPPPDFVDSRLLSCSFAQKPNYGHVLAATCEDGQILIMNTEYLINNTYPYHITDSEENGNALFSVTWSEVDTTIITTSGDHSVDKWKILPYGNLEHENSYKAHRCSVKTACFKPLSSDIFASGGRDGNIYVWDARCSSTDGPEQFINHGHRKHNGDKTETSITCVIFQNDYKLFSCADKESNINVWDLRKTYLRSTERPMPVFQLPSLSSRGYTHMVLDNSRTRLYANCFSGNIYCYNAGAFTKTPERIYLGHVVGNFFSKLSMSADDRYLASTDTYNKIHIWRTNSPGSPITVLSAETDALKGLSDVSWCPEDELKIATSSDHPSPWIWSVQSLNENESTLNHNEPATFVERIRSIPPRCRQTIPKSFKSHTREKETTTIIKLPNSVSDGFQIHTCHRVEKKAKVNRNWLTNLHNQQTKKIETEKEVKTVKTPPSAKNSKNSKRKRYTESPSNNLTKYFKKTDENLMTGN